MIASTRHSYKSLNSRKSERLQEFIEEYSRVAGLIVESLWANLPDDLSVSKYQDYKSFSIQNKLSARAMQCAANQAAGIVKAAVEKQRRRLWVRDNRNPDVEDVKFCKPKINFIAPQLNANCLDFEIGESKAFAGFVKLASLGDFLKILAPIDITSQLRKWENAGANLSPSIKLFKKGFQLSWSLERSPVSQGAKVIGLDQGYKTVATLSDGQTTPEKDHHGHSLESVIGGLSRKKKGSKGFSKAQTHRKNFVNWSINQLNLSGLKELRLEKVVNIRHGKSCSRSMSHWSNPEIRDKILRRCEWLEVPVVEQSCVYRSQRCSCCGLVRKANRKGKIYECKGCGKVGDADLNAALNHEADLPPIPFGFRVLRKNLGSGLLWTPSGIFEVDGSELIVPDSQAKIFQ